MAARGHVVGLHNVQGHWQAGMALEEAAGGCGSGMGVGCLRSPPCPTAVDMGGSGLRLVECQLSSSGSGEAGRQPGSVEGPARAPLALYCQAGWQHGHVVRQGIQVLWAGAAGLPKKAPGLQRLVGQQVAEGAGLRVLEAP